MIHIRQTLLVVLLLLSLITKAQKKEPVLLLKEGRVKTTHNINDASIGNFNSKAVRHRNKVFALLQFESLPTAEIRNLLSKHGIELLEYIPENAYTVSITGKLNTGLLKNVGGRTILQPTSKQKMHPALAQGNIPDWAKKVKGKVDVWVSFPKVYKASEVVQYLQEKKMEVLSTEQQAYRIISLRLATNRLDELAILPFIEFVEPVPAEAQPLNMDSRNATRANVLNTAVADGGKGLTGEGVVIGVGDNGNVQSHADLSGSRLINKAEYADAGIHAIHVTTTTAGAGNVNEYYKGYAPKATVISQIMSGILFNADMYSQDYGMVLTNNSYATGGYGCGYYGEYNFYSRMLDQQAYDFPYLQHVFAAGNEGGISCNGYPAGFHTVFGAAQAAKNVVTVGGTEWNGPMWSGSSRGPVMDGRLKPEISAQAAYVFSGGANSGYGWFYGTSMASPAVTGGLALLYQRYRQLHGGANPKNGLMKALLCNGSADLGNTGPDYSYGFGWMHLLHSVEMLEKEQYKLGSLTNGAEQDFTLNVPANTAHLKVMLYWNDPAASLMSSKALVNDLDLKVSDPALAINLPRVLDPLAAGVLNVATTGADHLNNMEQVIIDNPTPGSYSINISGTVAQNPSQEYFVVYDIIPVSTTLTNPSSGLGVAPGETVQINWDSYGDPASTFTLKYSTDNGATWIDINTAVSATTRQYGWVVPNTPTNQALVRIERNGTTISHTTQPFTIIGVPSLSLSPVQCEEYIAITWPPVNGATGYEVMMKGDNDMVSVATTSSTDYVISGLSKDSLYWVSVRALVEGKPGRRAVAISRQPNSGTCAGTISDNDLKLDAIARPTIGRRYTSTELSSANLVTIRIKNLDDVPVTGFTASYKLNNNNWVSEPVNVTIPAGSTYDHTFSTTEDISGIGSYTLVTVVENNTPDPVQSNDTLWAVVRHLGNPAIDLTTPFMDDLEGALAAVYNKDTMGLAGIDRYDFDDNSSHGRLSTAGPVAYSGTKSIMLTSNGYNNNPTGIESVTGTYNLKGYDVGANDIRLNFKAGYGTQFDNKLWVRGSDDQSWIELLDFASYQNYNNSISNIELTDTLFKYGQNFSSSFQLKWSAPPINYNVLILDDISIREAFDDMQLLNIDAAMTQICVVEPLEITVRNSSNKVLTNVPVKFSIDGGGWVTEIIPFINPNTTIQYKFNNPLSFSEPGVYSLTALVDFPTDNIHLNDTLSTPVYYASLVNTFPYLQNFESGKGGWHTIGSNSIWEYGTPSSPKLNNAASGTKAWKTNQLGVFTGAEAPLMLYSPCLDISGMANPTLSFSVAMDLGVYKDTIADIVWVDYTTDDGIWNQLIDTAAVGTNWYIPNGYYAWSEQKRRWHVVTMGLPRNAGIVRLRIGRYSHPDATTEGIAIDDIHIYDSSRAIYDGVSPSITATKAVSGNDWVDFETEGKLVASIHPNGQNLGNTQVQAFIYSGPVRYNSQQYYHNRNITIKPEVTALADSVTVRMYFLDSESEALINATGCNGCAKPGSTYELGVSKYSDPLDEKENGTIEDNNGAFWSFIPTGKVTKVPFQKGYYAEFKVKDFSEFWLSNAGMDGMTPLPLRLMDFTAQRASGEDVLLKWSTAQETNVSHFEVELAKGDGSHPASRFSKIGEVKASGNSITLQNYSYSDTEPGKFAVRYYRLKMVDEDGSFTYSPVRSVVFSDALTLQIYPNPSTGVFNLVYQLNPTESLEAVVYDINGKVVQKYHKHGTGGIQQLEIDLSPSTLASGIYMLQTVVNGKRNYFKLHKL